MCQSLCNSMWSLLSGYPAVGQSCSVPDGGCPERAWWRHVSPCFLSCHALYNPQEEDSVPPPPPLPESYEPDPPTVPPLPSRAGIRPTSLHRPEDRKANQRNGTHSVSSLTRRPHGWHCLQLCHHSSLLAVMVFTFILMDFSCLLDCFWFSNIPFVFTWCHSLIVYVFQLIGWSLTCVFLFSHFNLFALCFFLCVDKWWFCPVLLCLALVANQTMSDLKCVCLLPAISLSYKTVSKDM